ncbi:MAG: hypothetical protein ABIG37_00480 [Nanoarchaeota archaeon]|nr:hypothetical protein [Nanoarchaeota archaeon]
MRAYNLDFEIKEIFDIEKEISILYELGVNEDEIRYLIYLKKKRMASLKWGD